MSQMVLARPRIARCGGRWCRECGYSLRGLPPNRLCPECGHPPEDRIAQTSPHTAWSRSVCAGLVLLMVVTLQAVSSVLIQPFSDQIGGTAPALNLPGPKLWAMPLLQRPIGRSPQTPGVVGTRTAMLSLLAVWLVTAPTAASRMQKLDALRLTTRWTSVALFGLAFGTMMNSQGLWTDDLPPFRALLVAGVELPATTLLYLYLRRLSMQMPGQARRDAFERVIWCAPLVILGGAMILGTQWWLARLPASGTAAPPSKVVALGGTAAYGAVAMLCGAACAAAVGSLAFAFARLAFPSAGRTLRWIRAAARGSWINITIDQGRRIAVAAGLGLLLYVMLLGNERTLWMTSRDGLGGNLPFVNFPGPKVWASLSMSVGRDWYSLNTVMKLIALNLAAVWLIATPIRQGDAIRTLNRWLPILLMGGSAGFFAMLSTYLNARGELSSNRSELFALSMVVCELPATILLYVLLARVAEDVGRPRLAKQFRALCFVIVTLVATSLLMFALSSRMLGRRTDWTMLTIASIYGAAALLSAAGATVNVVRLIGAVVMRSPNDETRSPNQVRMTKPE